MSLRRELIHFRRAASPVLSFAGDNAVPVTLVGTSFLSQHLLRIPRPRSFDASTAGAQVLCCAPAYCTCTLCDPVSFASSHCA